MFDFPSDVADEVKSVQVVFSTTGAVDATISELQVVVCYKPSKWHRL